MGVEGMYQIENIDYDKAILEFRRRGYKAVIFLLYEDNDRTLEYPLELAKQFNAINSATEKKLAFITKYSNYKQIKKNNCFLQAFFGESCKIFLENIASPFWQKLQRPVQSLREPLPATADIG